MNGQSLLFRACPVCGLSSHDTEMQSTVPAETLSFDELRPHWIGMFKEKVFFSYDRCKECGLLFAPTFFSKGQLEQLYQHMAPNMELAVPTSALEATQLGYWRKVRRAAALVGGYLEIGPDLGYIVRRAAEEGNFDRFWLFEPNRSVHAQLGNATMGKPHSISVEMDDLSIVPDGSVGLAVMVHVLDHVLDPIGTLQQVHAKLKPDGILMLVTHNERSLLRKVMGVRWPPFCLQHPELYNSKSITATLHRAGFGSARIARSRNYFPIGFMIRQGAWTMGLKLDRMPLPKASIGLRLGNMITIAGR